MCEAAMVSSADILVISGHPQWPLTKDFCGQPTKDDRQLLVPAPRNRADGEQIGAGVDEFSLAC